MFSKKIFLIFFLLFLLGATLFCGDFDIEDINGIWLDSGTFNSHLNSPYDRGLVRRGLWEGHFVIRWDKATKKGFFQYITDRGTIQSVETVGKRVTIKYLERHLIYNTEEYYETEYEIVLEYVSRDLFRVISSHYNSNPDYLYRISDFAKKPRAKGKINNHGVRFRNKPELTSGVWFNFYFGEEVEILGISAEKQTIGELEAYWYEVRIEFSTEKDGGLDGWVFGAYLDVENRAELEAKLKKLRLDGG